MKEKNLLAEAKAEIKSMVRGRIWLAIFLKTKDNPQKSTTQNEIMRETLHIRLTVNRSFQRLVQLGIANYVINKQTIQLTIPGEELFNNQEFQQHLMNKAKGL